MAISHLLLDIEGTTCPVSFVADVLFPYARRHMAAYLRKQADDPEVAALVSALAQAWQSAAQVDAQALLDAQPKGLVAAAAAGELSPQAAAAAVLPYLTWLISHDIKLTPLKDLQGRIWQSGYASGDLVAPLFPDVDTALHRWHQQGLVLAVYSSGSVPAQQLLYGHSTSGDLRPLFSHWFDTRIGAKHNTASYRAIASAMECPPSAVLFISDALAELEAAHKAGMACLFSDRDGNPNRDSGPFARISDYRTFAPGP